MLEKYKKKIVLICSVLIGVMMVGNRINEFEIHGIEEEITINYRGKELAGSLYRPKGKDYYPVMVFVHGDGAIDRTNKGGYAILFNTFLEQGIACFSYDKPGIGNSEGNWLEQDMLDRAEETVAVVDFLKERSDVSKVGVIAFSQGGWVVSKMAMMPSSADAYIVVGGAINWRRQGKYYEEEWLADSDLSEEMKEDYRLYSERIDQTVLSNDYTGYLKVVSERNYEEPMSNERFQFVYLNMDADMTGEIEKMEAPFMGMFGNEDINVDAVETYKYLEQTFQENNKSNYELVMYEDANHALLKSRYEPRNATTSTQLEMFFMGKGIFVDNALKKMAEWSIKMLN